MTTIVSGLAQIQASRSPFVGADSDGGQSRPTPVVFQQGPIVENSSGIHPSRAQRNLDARSLASLPIIRCRPRYLVTIQRHSWPAEAVVLDVSYFLGSYPTPGRWLARRRAD